jgi:hypothetical protein
MSASLLFSVAPARAGPRLRVADWKLMLPMLIVSLVTPTSDAKFAPAVPGVQGYTDPGGVARIDAGFGAGAPAAGLPAAGTLPTGPAAAG